MEKMEKMEKHGAGQASWIFLAQHDLLGKDYQEERERRGEHERGKNQSCADTNDIYTKLFMLSISNTGAN